MNQELLERLRDLANEVEQSDGDLLFVSTDDKAIVEAAKAMVDGGTVSCKVIGAMLYYVADMAEEQSGILVRGAIKGHIRLRMRPWTKRLTACDRRVPCGSD